MQFPASSLAIIHHFQVQMSRFCDQRGQRAHLWRRPNRLRSAIYLVEWTRWTLTRRRLLMVAVNVRPIIGTREPLVQSASRQIEKSWIGSGKCRGERSTSSRTPKEREKARARTRLAIPSASRLRASGTGICANGEPGGACLQKIKRSHKCQFCLSPGHRNSDCPKQA